MPGDTSITWVGWIREWKKGRRWRPVVKASRWGEAWEKLLVEVGNRTSQVEKIVLQEGKKP